MLAAGYQSGVSTLESLGADLFYHDSLPRLSERSAEVDNPTPFLWEAAAILARVG